VATAHKTVYKAGRAFTNRGATQLAVNCDAVRANIEEFRAMVPLVQVGARRARLLQLLWQRQPHH
jgi:hypothetical protein